ncbi:MAG: GNAT family N-acetyltransferase, partial [Deferrisomatales bacterium]|nr:GNAT family N-acetyltransferase [Deferrisomatales bacterium]
VAALWSAWEREGVEALHLERVRPDSQVLGFLAPLARERCAAVAVEPAGVSVEVALPGSWDGYLERLDKKQRHELRRKLRRLQGAGAVEFRTVRSAGAGLAGAVAGFFRLFRDNREDKAAFLTPGMEAYFGAVIDAAARDGLLNLGLLELGGALAAAVLCFDHQGRTHLYNNGYSREFAPLGVGLLSKVLSLRDSLERGVAVYDLLAGDEDYKFHLGGGAVTLFRCVIRLRPGVGVP